MSIALTICQQESKDVVRLSANFFIRDRPLELWFEIPIRYKEYLTETADPFLMAVLFPAMHANLPVRIVNKPVSQVLLRNLRNVQQAWHQWKPERYNIVQIETESVSELPASEKPALCPFTGGVDGAFVLWDNLLNDENPFPYQIGAILYVEGFHIPLTQQESSAKLLDNLRKISFALDIELITVRTNLRRFGNWYDFHGTALAACLTLFKGKFNAGLMGSSHPYAYLRFPWGSNPVTDPMLSSGGFSIINYGGGYTRLEKIEKLIRWRQYQEVVNVCIKSYHLNCGRCEKCIRTLLAYKVSGFQAPATFKESTLSPLKIMTLLAYQPQEIKDYSGILRRARKTGTKNRFLYFLLALNIFMNKVIRVVLNMLDKEQLTLRNKKHSKIYQHDA